METKTQSHCWWFESHNSSKLSPWLQSTLSELNEKTKTMLKIIEADADSFAQRAEMYYKKRPELISMVEDFYRAHRSLAERYDQLKSDRVVRIRSPLSQSVSLSKVEYEDVFDSGNSVKSFDSFTEGAYSSEEAAESEVDDPEEVDDAQMDQDETEMEHTISGGASYVELMKLRDELDHLRQENEYQKTIIKQKDVEKEELLKRLSDNVNELRKFREEKDAIREDNLIALKEISEVSVPCDEVIKPKDEVERLKMENLYHTEQIRKKAEEVLEITEKFEEAKFELIKLEQELQKSSGYFKNGLAVKESELLEVTRQFEVTKSELVKLRDEMRGLNVHLNAAHVGEYEDRKVEMRHFNGVVLMKDDRNCEAVEQLNDAFAEKDMDKEVITQQKNAFAEIDAENTGAIRCLSDAIIEKDTEKDELIRQLKYKLAEKDAEKSEAMRRLKDAIIEKDMEKNEAIKQLNNTIEEKEEEKRELIRQLNNALEEKDEEKREVIRQLSIAMEILREESMRLKKTLVSISPRKESAEFQIFKGVNVGKIFSSSSSHEANVL